MPSIIAALKLGLFFLWCLVIVPPQLVLLCFTRSKPAYILPYFWHKGVCLIFGIKVKLSGTPVRKGQILYVSNHMSYLDIPVIGTVLRASFVAKKDVASWPVFGFLSKLQQTAFIERSRNAAVKEANALDTMMQEGKSLVVFPEGTSTDGREVIPFKSSLFSLALLDTTDKSLAIQPFTITMERVDGRKPETQDLRDIYAWHRDMQTELPAHLWRFAKSRGALIHLDFHPSIQARSFDDRKTLAKYCHEQVSKGVAPATQSAMAA